MHYFSSVGVHSIERSAQEDALLVLFNTAISNLVSRTTRHGPRGGRDGDQSRFVLQVLFRNNFALNRDITGLFQSFQSSSTVLDSKANPSLFQSTLVIIIKVRLPRGHRSTCADRIRLRRVSLLI